MAASFDSDDDVLAVAVVLHHIRKRRAKHRQRRWWVRPWLSRRPTLGAFQCLLNELRNEDAAEHANFLRLEPQHFDFLFEAVWEDIQKKNTVMRRSIEARERLAVTLRFLASGDSFTSLSYLYRIRRQALGQIIPEACEAIYKALSEKYLKVPNTEEEWQTISNDFRTKWAFPNCIGAMDGKHIALKAPNSSGSLFYNYKGCHSIVLLAVVDAHYRFILYDVGVNGRHSDAGIFASSEIAAAIENNSIPPPKQLSGWHTALPHVIVGDEAFPLKTTSHEAVSQQRPHHGPKSVQLSTRPCQTSIGKRLRHHREPLCRQSLPPGCACSQLLQSLSCAHVWHFTTSCELNVMCDMHKKTRRTRVCQWNREMSNQGGNRNALDARDVRNSFQDYFTTDGAVDWQWDRC